MVRLKGENVLRSMRRVQLRKTYRVLRSTGFEAMLLGDAPRYFWGTQLVPVELKHPVPVQSKHLEPVVLFEQRRSSLSIARPV